MSSNSVCNHTRDKQIGLPLRGRPILLSLVGLQTELDSTQSYYHYLLYKSQWYTEWWRIYENDTISLWLAIRIKIMTSCTWAFLPRIIVYNHYVWAFIPYTTIYIAYIRVFNTHICAKSNALLYGVLKTIYMRTCQSPRIRVQKVCVYAGFRNQTWYKLARKVPLTE